MNSASVTAEKITEWIQSALKADATSEEFALTLPHRADPQSPPLTVYFRRIKSPYVPTGPLLQRGANLATEDCDDLFISDGGWATSVLAKRLGNLTPHLSHIRAVLENCGDFTLAGGRAIEKRYAVYAEYTHRLILDRLITAALTVANLDILPPESKDGRIAEENI